jgi:hypothetical protein
MAKCEPPLVLSFPNNWYRGDARLTGRNVFLSEVSSRSAQAVAVAYSREAAMVIIPVGIQGSAATELCDWIAKEGGRASLLQGSTEAERIQSLRSLLPYGRLDVLLNIAPPHGRAFGDFNDPEKQGATAAETIAPTIAVLSERGCPPHLVISAIFDIDDDCGYPDEAFAAEEAAHVEHSQALRDRNIRVTAVRISSAQLKSAGAVDAYLEEVAMAFVYLATDEGANMNGLVLAKEIDATALH